MQSLKPVVDQEMILSLLKENFQEPIQELDSVQGAMIAQALSFRVSDKEYILRLKAEAGYKKEAFIYEHFVSPTIPIPPILNIGVFENLSYAISEKMPGKGLSFLSEDEYKESVPSIIETLFAIHQADVRSWQGYGWLDDEGIGMFRSWKDFIAYIIEEERPEGFYGKWHILFQTTFLERDFFEKVYKQMLKLLEKCPEERYLLHGGYGYNNVLAQDGRVTAVLDWIDSMYGDFVYDIAYLHQWPPYGINFSELVHQYYAEKGISISNYRERLLCYQLHAGLDGLRFFAKTNNQEVYQVVRQKLENLLSLV